MDVRGADDQNIGRVAGVLIDPAERRLRFFVVASRGSSRRYLLPTDQPARMDPERKLLQVDVDPEDLPQYQEFSRSTTADMSDDDMLTALFAKRTA